MHKQPTNTSLYWASNVLFHHLIYYLSCFCASSHPLLIAEMLPSVAHKFPSALPILQHAVVREKHQANKRSTSSHGGKEKENAVSFQNNVLFSPSLHLPLHHTSVTFFLCGKIWCEKQPKLISNAVQLDLWLQKEAAISSPSTVAKPHSDASKWICDPPLPSWSPAGSEKQLGCSSVRCVMEGRGREGGKGRKQG